MPTMPQKQSLFGALNALADEIQTEKQAAARVKQAAARVKQAGPTPSDPGGYQGASSHPTTQIDNNVQNASEGARSSENESDVKDEVGKPSVNSASDAKPGESQDQQVQVGTKKSPTGEDPATEDDYKGTKDDPGTSHPATTEDGEKYGSVSFKEAHSRATTLANDILADLANGFGSQLNKGQTKQAAPAQPQQPSLLAKASAAVKPATDQAVQAGYELAAALGVEKTAAQVAVQSCIDQTIRDAQLDADLFGGYMTAFQKKAEGELDEAGDGEDHSAPGDEASGASEAPPDAGAGDAGAPAGGGGLDALLGAGGGDLGGGGMGGAGDDMGAPPNEEEALQELAAALEELGIPIEALAQAGQGDAGAGPGPDAGMAGGAPGMAGGGAPPPDAAPAAGEGLKLAQAVRNFKLSGRYQIKQASTKRARHIRDVMKAHVREVMGLK